MVVNWTNNILTITYLRKGIKIGLDALQPVKSMFWKLIYILEDVEPAVLHASIKTKEISTKVVYILKMYIFYK